MTVINCFSQWENVVELVNINEPTQKTGVIDNARSKWLSAAFAKIKMELWDTDSDHESDTDSSYGLSDFGSESDGSDQDIY